jgi:hypothetical protein
LQDLVPMQEGLRVLARHAVCASLPMPSYPCHLNHAILPMPSCYPC